MVFVGPRRGHRVSSRKTRLHKRGTRLKCSREIPDGDIGVPADWICAWLRCLADRAWESLVVDCEPGGVRLGLCPLWLPAGKDARPLSHKNAIGGNRPEHRSTTWSVLSKVRA